MDSTLTAIDHSIQLFLLNLLRPGSVTGEVSHWLDGPMIALSTLGDWGMVWIAAALVLLIFPKTRKWGVGIGIALLLSLTVANGLLKHLIDRPRPCMAFPIQSLMLIPNPGESSFPSGHTTSSFAAAMVLMGWKKKAGIPAFLLAGLIGLSRLYLYVHYPSDVLCGMLLGIGLGALALWILKKIPLFRQKEKRVG
ncbi:MAG: phosphatase PAP2 family protein [Oscillospiraceae bacterium]